MIDAAIGIQIIQDPHVNDYDEIKRTWRERLLSWPWRPWDTHKSVYNPKYYKIGADKILCSPASAAQLTAHVKRRP